MTKKFTRKPKFSRTLCKSLLISLAASLIICLVTTLILNSALTKKLKENEYNLIESIKLNLQSALSDGEISDMEEVNLSLLIGRCPLLTGRDISVIADGKCLTSTNNAEQYIDTFTVDLKSDIVYIKVGCDDRIAPAEQYADQAIVSQVLPFASFIMDDSGDIQQITYSVIEGADLDATPAKGELVVTSSIFDNNFISHNYMIRLSPNTRIDSIFANTNGAMFVLYGLITLMCAIVAFVAAILTYNKSKRIYSEYTYRTNLTNILAHDLKTPLMAMSGYAENYEASSDPAKKDYYVSQISKNTSYMNDIINNVLALTSLEKATARPREDVDTGAVVDDILNQLSTSIRDKDLKVSKSLSSSKISTDPITFKSVLVALIENSVKFAPHASEIILKSSDDVIFSIRNKYDGDIENKDKLTDAFTRGSKSRGEHEGTGLGLAIADTGLKKLGYSLDIDIEDNTFTASIR